MLEEDYQSPSQQSHWKEAVITALVEWIPSVPGVIIRRLIYRTVFSSIGTHTRIYSGVKFWGADGIRIGSRAKLQSGVRLNNYGQNSKISIDDRVILDRGVDIRTQSSGHIKIGKHTFVGSYVCLVGKSITIGEYCLIASQSGIYAANHNFADPTRKIRGQGFSFKGIVIEDDCWLGNGVRVVDGVTIGQGSVIGAGAVVTRDIPPYSIAVGVPARVVASRKSSEQLNSIENTLA
jgi:acetyltransferase-like isoleucine patch superfamily enzyme